MIMKNHGQVSLFTPVLIAGSLILLISFAIRSTFGLFQIPIAEDFLWARSEFSLAIAIQNLAWGIGTPLFSAFAEKYGDRKAISLGLILYALGCGGGTSTIAAATGIVIVEVDRESAASEVSI